MSPETALTELRGGFEIALWVGGPLLLVVAKAIADGGGRVVAVVDAHRRMDWFVSARDVASRPDLVAKGLGWRRSLASRGVPGISGLDTRALTRHLRDRGTMRGCLSTQSVNADELVEKARRSPKMEGLALADRARDLAHRHRLARVDQ